MVGYNQRQQFASSSRVVRKGPEPVPTTGHASFLVSFLITLWSWGLFSPQMLQKLAARALKDLDGALADPARAQSIRNDLAGLASIGSYGTYQGNCNRDLKGKLGENSINLQWLLMPLKQISGSAWYMCRTCMLWPHELFATMGNLYPKAWEKLMCPSRARLHQFWTNMHGNPQLEGT